MLTAETINLTVSVVHALATLVLAVGTIVGLFWVKDIRHNTNSMMDDRVKEVKEASLAKGKLDGRAEVKQESRNGSQ